MSAPKWHIERLREQLRREIGVVIAQEIRDPRIPDIVTITEVKLAKDTRNATVYASIMGGDEGIDQKEAINALNKAAPFIQRLVASRVVVKNFPRLVFKLDTSIEHGMHINELFKSIQNDLDQQIYSDGDGDGADKQDGAI
ncbi:MAG: 30S ribosome-binding factor RbfA [Chitinispirillales bacterium]|jgi:ribosome-binding factor A|nr:30S ribosome-binding factor RbfA [Chitinispirillales bacterium]